MFITGMQYGDKVAVHVSRGAVFGMNRGISLYFSYMDDVTYDAHVVD